MRNLDTDLEHLAVQTGHFRRLSRCVHRIAQVVTVSRVKRPLLVVGIVAFVVVDVLLVPMAVRIGVGFANPR